MSGSLQTASLTAWTASLSELLARASVGARTDSPPWTTGTAVARVSGAPPGSVWVVTLPDGAHAFGVATTDGEVLIPGAPSAVGALQRLDDTRQGDSL